MTTIRVWFTKTGEASYISLLDLQRVMQRALKRSGLPVWYTQGFNPHIYMTFAAPLSLGQESIAETVDFKTQAEEYDWDAACAVLTECLPRGVDVVRIKPADLDANEIAYSVYEVRYRAQNAAAARAAWQAYNDAPSAEVIKEGKRGKKKTIDLKTHLAQAELIEEDDALCVRMNLPTGNTLNVNPVLLMGWLEETQGLPITAGNILRTGVYTKDHEKFA